VGFASQSLTLEGQMDAGARQLEIDITYADPDDVPLIDTGPPDVYVCHCSEAPFVGPGSIAGMTYAPADPRRTFANVIHDIDVWLMAHPTQIVFVTVENTSDRRVTPAEANAAVASVSPQAGTYVHTGLGDAWPTQAQLVSQGKRMIILSDAGSNVGGGYINAYGYTAWKRTNQTYAAEAGEENKFLRLTNFTSGVTDVTTAARYNRRIAVDDDLRIWAERYPDRMPSFYQVEHVQVGAALDAVNAIQGNAATKIAIGMYMVTIRTGTSSGAGTDSNIYLTIYGTDGNTGEIRLNPLRSNDVFENGATETFIIAGKNEVGQVTGVTLRSDGSYPGSAWQLAEVTVTSPLTQTNFRRSVDRWIATEQIEVR
jgi:hypothetical protein